MKAISRQNGPKTTDCDLDLQNIKYLVAFFLVRTIYSRVFKILARLKSV